MRNLLSPAGGLVRAVVLASGDELLTGRRVDTNSAWIAAQLEAVGLSVIEHRLLGDDSERFISTLRDVARPGTLVVGTGGLGPTRDDLTRRALAALMDDEVVEDQEAIRQIEAWFSSRGRTMADANRLQAERPSRAVMLPNHRGTAPGLLATHNGATIAWFPGPPAELRPMFEASIVPSLQSHMGPRASTMLMSVGLGESNIADILGTLMDRGRDPSIGTTASHGVVRIHISSGSNDQAAVDDASQRVQSLIGDSVIASGAVHDIEAAGLPGLVVECLRQHGLKVATAESCTGGLVSSALTDVPGCSRVFDGGVVSYHNDVKSRFLGVSEHDLRTHGAVSQPVVEAMAAAIRTSMRADIGVAISGIAGPGGGDEAKPVGTVWISVAGPGKDALRSTRHQFRGSREQVRAWATNTALAEILLAANGRKITWHTAAP